MKVSSLFLASRLVLALMLTGIGASAASGGPDGTLSDADLSLSDKASHLAGGYIVEFDPDTYHPRQRRSQQPHVKFHQHLSQTAGYDTRFEWNDPRTFVGLSVVLHDDNDYQKLLQAPGVKKIYQNRLHSCPTFNNDQVSASATGATHNVETRLERRDLFNPRQSMVSTQGLTGQQPGVNDTFPPHIMTGVDKLHALGFFGEGQVVGIIDTGIDYTHPALGDKPGNKPCFGPGCKVIGGHNFVGDNHNGTTPLQPSNDPFANCAGSGHGTHVAGIVAANDTRIGFTGVAPHAKIRAYRVFGCNGETSDDIIMAALNMGFSDGNDVLSLSLGSTSGWTEDSLSVVASRIVSQGTPVVIAGGNEGAYGAYFSSSPASGLGVVSINSVQNTKLLAYRLKVNSSKDVTKEMDYYTVFPFSLNGNPSLELYATSTDPNIANDACNPLPDNTPDLSNKLVLVARGTCILNDKVKNVYNKGGKYVLIYNSVSLTNLLSYASSNPGQMAGMISRENGLFLLEQFVAGNKKVTFDFSNTQALVPPDNLTGGLMSGFSTYTPTYENYLKSDFSAPGGNILSTWPVALGSYNVISGTSMATPFISGAYALYRSAHGGKTDPDTLRNVFTSTATPVRATKDPNSLFDTVVKQGAGLVNVYDAVFQQVTYTPHVIQLNDTRHFNGTQRVTVKNTSNQPRVYTIQHEPSATVTSLKNDSQVMYNLYPLPLTNQFANVQLSKTRLVVAPGQSASFDATFTPQGVAENKLPVYGGWLHLVAESNQYSRLRISYMGVKSDVSKFTIIDGTKEMFGYQLPALLQSNLSITDDLHSFNLQQAQPKDLPSFQFRFAYGIPFYQIDVVPANTTFTPSIPINDGSSQPNSPTTTASACNDKDLKFKDVKIIGTLKKDTYMPRNTIQDGGESQNPSYTVQLSNNLTLAQGGSIAFPEGSYRLLLRAQHALTEGTSMSDYDSYLSHSFKVTH